MQTNYQAVLEDPSRKAARRALVDAMNNIKQKKNQTALATYVAEKDRYFKGERGTYPRQPVFRDTFTYRQVNQAVFMARQIGGFAELLVAAGFRPHK